MDVLREASQIERAYLETDQSIYLSFTIVEHFTESQLQFAIGSLLRAHPFLRAALNDSVFIEKDDIHPGDHLTILEEIPKNEAKYTLTLSRQHLFHFYVQHLDEGSLSCLLVIHHAIADVDAAIIVLEDFTHCLKHPTMPLQSEPLHAPIEHFFPENASPEDVEGYAKRFDGKRPASCALPITDPSLPYEECVLKETTISFRADILNELKIQAKKHKLSFHSVIASLFLHAIAPTEDKMAAAMATTISLKRTYCDDHRSRGLFTGTVPTAIFLDLDPSDPLDETAHKYAAILGAKVATPDPVFEHLAMLSDKVSYFPLGLALHLSDAGKVFFRSQSTHDLIENISFSTPTAYNCPHITLVTYKELCTAHILYPSPWIAEETIALFLARLEQLLA